MLAYLWIALGSALGGVARYALSEAVGHVAPGGFPWGTLLVNVSGSFVIGAFVAMIAPDGPWMVSSNTRLFVAIGICGGYTTFSSFSLQTLNLMREGAMAAALGYIAASVILCLVAVWLGYAAGGLVGRGG